MKLFSILRRVFFVAPCSKSDLLLKVEHQKFISMTQWDMKFKLYLESLD